ncbi:MAG TPA: TMEM175 family protein [Terriglobales bacterium]|nr:TMEM175 family protein [Terriglobales bacterium]
MSLATREAGRKETGRVEAFSDGVFAIAMTLLVLNVKVPTSNQSGQLRSLLWQQWPSYVAFVISFAFIGIMWVNHHRLFVHIRRIDHTLLVLNGALLLGVTAVPFPTAVLAQYLAKPDEKAATMLYNGTYVVVAVFFNVLWRYAASGHRLLGDEVDAAEVNRITRQYAFGPLFYLACFALAYINVAASLALNVALAIFFALPPNKVTWARTHHVGVRNQ